MIEVSEKTELVILVENSGLEQTKAVKIAETLGSFFAKAEEWRQTIEGIVITNPSEVAKMKMARSGRLGLKEMRLECDKIVKSKRDEIKNRMSDDILEDKLWLKAFQMIEATFKNLESKAEEKEKFAERWEAEEKDKLKRVRTELLSQYVEDVSIYPLGDFSEDSFQELLNGQKLAYQARIDEEKREREARLAREKAEAEERERVRIENEKLKAEAAEAKRIQAEKDKAIEEERIRLKEESDKKIAQERAAREMAEKELRERQEKEARLNKEAEERAKADAKAKEIAERKAKRAPDKAKIAALLQNITLIELPGDLKSEEGKKIIEDVRILLKKIASYIEEKQADL